MEKVWHALQEKDSILVCDFDGTLTTSGSSMHGIVRVMESTAPFVQDRDQLYMEYGKRIKGESESAVKKELAELWWKEQMKLFIKYEVPENLFLESARILPPREEAVRLLTQCRNHQIPVWIVSAGMANVIECWLKCYEVANKDIHILANRVFYENGKPVNYVYPVTPWNKAEIFFQTVSINGNKELVFLGDRKEDVGWRSEDAKGFIVNGQCVEMTFI